MTSVKFRSFLGLFLFTLAVLIASGCGKAPQDGVHRTHYLDGTLRSELSFANGYLHGPANYYWPSGKEKSLLNYDRGRLDGLQQWFYKNGTLHLFGEVPFCISR